MLPVSRGFPESAAHDLRRGYLVIAPLAVNLMPVVDEGIAQEHTFREEERHTGRFVAESEKSQLLAELSVVALLCLFYAGEIFFQILFLCECRAVDADEHLVFLIAAPVCARNARELECLDGGGIGHMRTCAEICEIALAEEAYCGVLGQVVYQLCLVGLAHFPGELQRLFAGKSEALKLDIFLYYFFHLGFDFR